MLDATVLEVVDAVVAAERISRPLTLMLVIDVLDDPLTLIVAVRGEG
jgi:hypothetical protein